MRENLAKHWFQISGVDVVRLLAVRAGRPGPSLKSPNLTGSRVGV